LQLFIVRLIAVTQKDFQRSAMLQDPPTKSRVASVKTDGKVAIYALAALIVAAMIVWFAFLSWGLIEILQWLMDCLKT
jgi:hypothetical protein